VQEEDSQKTGVARDHIDRQQVGEIRRANVDVSANRKERRDGRELIEHGEIADVPGMQDDVRSLQAEVFRRRRVGSGMRVRDDCQP